MSPDRQRLVLALGQLLFQVVDVLSALAEAAVGEDALLQRDVGLDAVDDHFAQRPAHAADGLFAVGAVDDQLADQRAVIRTEKRRGGKGGVSWVKSRGSPG